MVESIRLLRVARERAVKSRTAAMVQLRDLIVTAPQALRDRLSRPKTIRGKVALCRRLRPSPGELGYPTHAAKFALRSIAQRIGSLDAEIAVHDRRLEQRVSAVAPRTTELLGISTGHAGRLLVTAGQNIDRLRGEGAFASLCGASPVPASSGKTTRHRLNYGGDRQANRTLHLIAVCHPRSCERTRAYARRRSAEGQDQAGNHALPQALHRPRDPPRPPRGSRRPRRPRPPTGHHHLLRCQAHRHHSTTNLTSIGTSVASQLDPF
jgi:transposase